MPVLFKRRQCKMLYVHWGIPGTMVRFLEPKSLYTLSQVV